MIPRSQMPQIEESDYPEFIEFAAQRGVEVLVRYLPPEKLQQRQEPDEFHPEKMPPEVRNKVVFISYDLYILDGNHRWALHILERTVVPCFEIKLSFEDAIDLMFQFPKTYRAVGDE